MSPIELFWTAKDNVYPKGELVKEDVLISNLSGFHFGPNIDL